MSAPAAAFSFLFAFQVFPLLLLWYQLWLDPTTNVLCLCLVSHFSLSCCPSFPLGRHLNKQVPPLLIHLPHPPPHPLTPNPTYHRRTIPSIAVIAVVLVLDNKTIYKKTPSTALFSLSSAGRPDPLPSFLTCPSSSFAACYGCPHPRRPRHRPRRCRCCCCLVVGWGWLLLLLLHSVENEIGSIRSVNQMSVTSRGAAATT